MAVLLGLGSTRAAIAESGNGSALLTMQRWLQAADQVANEQVTYEICGWGFIDLLTPLLTTVGEQGADVLVWDELVKRYENTARERRQTEAVLTAHGANDPMRRFTGLYATGGCTAAVRARIERGAGESPDSAPRR